MNIQKPLAIVCATLISAAGMYGIANHTYVLIGSGAEQPAAATAVSTIRTLPTVNVHLTAAQLQELQQEGHAPAASAS